MGTVLQYGKELGNRTTIAYIPVCLFMAQALSIILHALVPSWTVHPDSQLEGSPEEKRPREEK
jgi:hypothetical protein